MAAPMPEKPAPLAERDLDGAIGVCVFGDRRHAAVLTERRLYVLELPSLRETARAELAAQASALACDEALAAVGDRQGGVYAFDLGRGQLVARGAPLRSEVHALAVAGKPRRILAVANDDRGAQAVLLWAR